eukprot:scaffold2417_cov155-Amphora_coffeaeformis.AAC.1
MYGCRCSNSRWSHFVRSDGHSCRRADGTGCARQFCSTCTRTRTRGRPGRFQKVPHFPSQQIINTTVCAQARPNQTSDTLLEARQSTRSRWMQIDLIKMKVKQQEAEGGWH